MLLKKQLSVLVKKIKRGTGLKKYVKKRYIIGTLVSVLLFLILFLFVGKPKSGSYMLIVNNSNEMMYRGIRLNMGDGTFELIGGALDSRHAYTGTFVIEGNRLITSEEDSEITYVFNIVNRMVLQLNKEESVGWESRVTWKDVSGTDGEAYYIYLSDFLGRMIYR